MTKPKSYWVIAKECDKCAETPHEPQDLAYLMKEDKKTFKLFESHKEASEFVEDFLDEDLDEVIVMPLSEADEDASEGHHHG